MKKLLAIILILALLLPAAVLAEVNPVGCWVKYEILKTGAPAMVMLYLADDHTCYYMAQSFHKDSEGLGRVHVGTWEYKPDGIVYAKTGENTETQLKIADNNAVALDVKTFKYFLNISIYGIF